MKVKNKSSIYKSTWKSFSKAIRIKSRGICFTCQRKFAVEDLDAGHFVHGGNNKFAFWLDFDERNINAQCSQCNRYLHGNLNVYAERLIQKYGAEIIAELNALKWKSDEWSDQDLELIKKKSDFFVKNYLTLT